MDDAIADLLCLKTHYHGTSPKAYHSIMNQGADPGYGGKGGESRFYKVIGKERELNPSDSQGWNCTNRFFVCLDSGNLIFKRLIPRVYAIVACIGENSTQESDSLKKALIVFISILEGLCSPTLKFRFNDKDNIQFQEDTTGYPSGYVGFTQEAIATHHIGFFGSLNHGLNSEWFGRLKNNPISFTYGLLKLILISSIIGLSIFAAMNMPIFGLALGAYIAFCGVQAIARLVVPQSYKPANYSSSTQTLASTTIVSNETNEDEVTALNAVVPNAISI